MVNISTNMIYREIIRISSHMDEDTDMATVGKISGALSVLSSAMTLASVSPKRAQRLVIVAKGMINF